MDRKVIYYKADVPKYILRWEGAKYIFKGAGAYKVRVDLAEHLVEHDQTRFFETEKELSDSLNINVVKVSGEVLSAKVKSSKKRIETKKTGARKTSSKKLKNKKKKE